MTVADFNLLSPEQKIELIIYKGDLLDETGISEFTYTLYFYKKFYFEEVMQRLDNSILETNLVQKFAHFKKYLLAIRAEKLIH